MDHAGLSEFAGDVVNMAGETLDPMGAPPEPLC
jgi:hypothetical protein